jgi:hypothetical protein
MNRPHPATGGTPHRVSRRARDPQVIPWVIRTVEAEGGRATFLARGRAEHRVLETVRRDLPDGYVADLIWFTAGTPAGKRRHRDREIRLYVQRADLAGTRQVLPGDPQADLITRVGRQLQAERDRLRQEHPGWRHHSDPPPHPPPN